jgi:hypothetical protein
MQLLVFVSDDGSEQGTGPILFVRDGPEAVLPDNPRALEWRYFATIQDGDQLLGGERGAALKSIAEVGHFIARRMI